MFPGPNGGGKNMSDESNFDSFLMQVSAELGDAHINTTH